MGSVADAIMSDSPIVNSTKTDESTIMYAMYHDVGFTWNLAIWAILLNIVSFFGITLNSSILWITYKTSSLHGTANFNLAMGSFFEILHQIGHLLFLYITLSGQNFLPYPLAVHICSIALFGLGSVALSITFTAMDRLIYVLFPMFVFVVKPVPYLGTLCTLCLLSSSQNVWIFYKTAEQLPNFMISGSIDEILSRNPGKDNYSYYSLVLNFVTLGLYLTLGLFLKCKPKTLVDSASSRIYKSILVLITVRLSGFFAMRIFRLFIANSISPFTLRWNISESMSLLLNISTASTGPILYTTSKEYRTAFMKEFKPFIKLFNVMLRPAKVSMSQVRPVAGSVSAGMKGVGIGNNINNQRRLTPQQIVVNTPRQQQKY